MTGSDLTQYDSKSSHFFDYFAECKIGVEDVRVNFFLFLLDIYF